MSKRNLPHLVLTGLFCLAVLPGAVMNLLQPEMVVEMAATLGLPLSILSLVGIWKLLGVVALTQSRRWPRIAEWATAGFFFDLTGAAWVHAAAGDSGGIAPPLVILGLLAASRATRRLPARDPETAGASVAAA